MVAAHAGDLLHEFVLAMKHRIGLSQLAATIHAYPTFCRIGTKGWRSLQQEAADSILEKGFYQALPAFKSRRRVHFSARPSRPKCHFWQRRLRVGGVFGVT
jgi:hypothetical protein